MNKAVLGTICEKELLHSGDKVIVALSGGADSVSLLYALLSLRSQLQIEVMAAHVNHLLRGKESQRDEEFVKKLCESLDVPLFIHTEDVRALAKNTSQSEELCGRQVRYEFFHSLHLEHKAKIATAHTLSDSEETMLYNISRGTTLHGLCSIPYKRDYIVRPLLDVTRQQVEDYCSKNHLEFVTDSTNLSKDVCKRNKIRLSVMPHLREINEGFDANFSRLRRQLLSVDSYIQSVAEKELKACSCEYGLCADKLSKLHSSVLGYVLSLYITSCGASFENRHIDLCTDILCGGGAVCLVGGMSAVCRQGVFRVVRDDDTDFESFVLCGDVSVRLNGKEYSFKEISKNEGETLNLLNRKSASPMDLCGVTDDTPVVRTRRQGDTFAPIGRNVTKSLRKLQNELKIPSELRDTSLVIASGSTVLWCEHIGVSASGLVTDKTKKLYSIKITKGDTNNA